MADTCPGCGAAFRPERDGWDCGSYPTFVGLTLAHHASVACFERQIAQRDARIKELEEREHARATQANADLLEGRSCVNGKCHWGLDDSRATEYDGRCLFCRIAELESEITSYRDRLDLAERYHDEAEAELDAIRGKVRDE